jgi:hypothetical protein
MEVAQIDPTWIAMLSGALGGPIFAIWLAYYVMTKHIPKMIDDFRADIRHIMDQKFAGDTALARAIDDIRDTIRETHVREVQREERRIEERKGQP